jgi:hypothetical protein
MTVERAVNKVIAEPARALTIFNYIDSSTYKADQVFAKDLVRKYPTQWRAMIHPWVLPPLKSKRAR